MRLLFSFYACLDVSASLNVLRASLFGWFVVTWFRISEETSAEIRGFMFDDFAASAMLRTRSPTPSEGFG